jgi:hypothetical protein
MIRASKEWLAATGAGLPNGMTSEEVLKTYEQTPPSTLSGAESYLAGCGDQDLAIERLSSPDSIKLFAVLAANQKVTKALQNRAKRFNKEIKVTSILDYLFRGLKL